MKILNKSKVSDCQEIFYVNEVNEQQIYENEILIFGHLYVRCGIQFFHILNANCWLCLLPVSFNTMLSDKYEGNLHQTNSMELFFLNISIEYKNNRKIIKINTEIDRFEWIVKHLMAKNS